MKLTIVLPAVTSLLAFAFALALLDQWRERRRAYQLVWTIGMVYFGIASGCEAIGGASGWNDLLSRTVGGIVPCVPKRFSSSKPSMRGIIKSVTSTCTGARFSFSSASWPSDAVSTSKPQD